MVTHTAVAAIALSQVMDESFLLVLSTWTVDKLVAFMAKARFSHLVVLRQEGEVRYRYLFSRREVRDMIERSTPGMTLHQGFDLHEHGATREADASTEADRVHSGRVLVVEGDRVVGFIDTTEVPLAPLNFPAVRTIVLGAPDTSAPPFTAYPALSAPDTVPAAKPFDIFAGFRDQPDPGLRGSDPIHIDHPDSGDHCLVVLSGDGLSIEPEREYVPLKPNALVRFSGTLNPGVTQASVKALFIYAEQVIGSARRDIRAEGGGEAAQAVSGTVGNPCRMSMPGPESAVDITVSLNHKSDGALEWLFLAPSCPQPKEGTKLPPTFLPDTKEFAGDLMRDLRTQQFRGPFARNMLETVGQQVAALLPPEFFDLLHAVQAKIGRTPTLLLLTNETYVPWELAYLAKPLDAGAPPFLGAQTFMGRWLEDPNVMLPPSVALDVKRITVVASEYGLQSGQRKLEEAIKEKQALCDEWGAIPLEATINEMQVMVTGAKIAGHLVHFAVHGYSDPAANNQSLLLADKTQLPASAMTGAHTCGETPRFSFVFLNACQVGTPGRSLGHAGGFPGVLVRGGTLGFIAPLWDVHDDVAREAAEAFYAETFKGGSSVGSALHARRGCYKNDSTTPVAYIYYGHPGLRLNRVN